MVFYQDQNILLVITKFSIYCFFLQKEPSETESKMKNKKFKDNFYFSGPI